jgi:hypothetical protein
MILRVCDPTISVELYHATIVRENSIDGCKWVAFYLFAWYIIVKPQSHPNTSQPFLRPAHCLLATNQFVTFKALIGKLKVHLL